MNGHACPPPADLRPARPIAPARLIEANINPATGRATDYLNHFNEAIMMLELIPAMPECAADLMGWRAMSYCFSGDVPLTGVAQPAVDALLER
jgi:hypothetical protein